MGICNIREKMEFMNIGCALEREKRNEMSTNEAGEPMLEYKRVETTYAVWAAIRDSHPTWAVFAQYTDINEDTGIGEAFNSWGFRGMKCPTIEALTTWNVDPEHPYTRENKHSQYWLCVGDKEEE
jgi:hypothetical protein